MAESEEGSARRDSLRVAYFEVTLESLRIPPASSIPEGLCALFLATSKNSPHTGLRRMNIFMNGNQKGAEGDEVHFHFYK